MDREAPELHCTRAIRPRQNPRCPGIGLAACQKGYSVAFTTAAALVHELMEARDERRLRALQKHLNTVKLLIIGELGYVPFTAVGAELLFEVFS
jgi:DNA replication protein DnaC